MANLISPGDELFLDTSYAIALSTPRDQFHARAINLASEIKKSQARLVTTRAVLLEIGNSMSRLRYRSAAMGLLWMVEADPMVEVLPMSEELYTRALELYCDRADKEWGLTDCASFVVMSDRVLTLALTADEHYRQAGFRPLLREGK
jgi:uncharacterized protein